MSSLRATVPCRFASRSSFLRGGDGKRMIRSSQSTRRKTDRCNAVKTEANLFARISRVLKSYANAIVSAAEDPEKMLEQTVNEMQEDLIKMRQASAQVMASQKQLENKYKQASQTADEWYKRAQLALQKGDEDLAKEALKRRKVYADDAKALESQLGAQKDAVDRLIQNTKILESKLAEAKSKKDTLKARAASAKTSRKVNDMVGGLSTSNALAAFEKMEEKVLSMEAEAEAAALLTGDSISKEFKMLEAGDDVDFELAELKSNLLGEGSAKQVKGQLPSAREVESQIDMELDELRKKAGDL